MLTVAVFWILGGIPALVGVALLGWTFTGLWQLPRLSRVSVDKERTWPGVTIVVPACNEEEKVGAAMSSLLAVDYPDLSIVAVNDRSVDRTGEILDALSSQDRLTVTHVFELPEGWLGKLNALQQGVSMARADWLLFMDADTHLSPLALQRAIVYCTERSLDCLSVVPKIHSAGLVCDTVFNLSLALLSAGGRLRAVEDRDRDDVAATGAFILVRKTAFDRTPGFEWIRLEVADDFGLALMIKSHGGRVGIVNGDGQIALSWYRDFAEMTRAFQKNCFGILAKFSIMRGLLISALLVWFGMHALVVLLEVPRGWLVVPFLGLVSWTTATLLATIATGRSPLPALAWPVGCLCMAWIMLRSAVIGWRIGGIEWRGVLYKSETLASHQRVQL